MTELSVFLSWKALILDKTLEITKNRETYDKFKEYNESIIKYGFLPDPITQFTDEYMSKIIVSIADLLLNCDTNNIAKKEYDLIKLYLESFYELGIYGAFSQEKIPLSVLNLLLSNTNQLFVKGKTIPKFRTFLLKKLHSTSSIEAFKYSIEITQNMEMLSLVLELISQISKFDQNFNEQEFFDLSINSIKRIISLNKEIVAVKYLDSSFDSIQNFIPKSEEANQYFLKTVMPILIQFITSENLDQRSNALSQFLKYGKINIFKKKVAAFFEKQNNFTKFSSVNLHDSLSRKMGELMSIIISESKELGKPEIISEIWNRQKMMKKKKFELSTFYDTFLHIGTYLKSDLFNKFIDCILEAQPSFSWFEMIDKLPSILSTKKGTKEAFQKIREKLWSYINSPFNENDQFLLSLHRNAKNCFIHMIGFKANESDIERIKNIQQTDKYFFYELLNSLLDHYKKIDQKTVSEFLLSLLRDLSVDNHSPIMIKDIKKLCKLTNHLDNEQLKLIIDSIEFIPDCFKLLNLNSENKKSLPDNVTFICKNIDQKYVNLEFYEFIKEFIIDMNSFDEDGCITKLPLKHENLIWKYSILESPVRDKFAKFLSRTYQMNDGEQLNDSQIIHTFLKTWDKYFLKKQENEIHINNLLKVLSTFIDIYESNIYRDLNKFNTPLSIERAIDIYTVNATCEKPEFSIILKYAKNYTIESVVEEIHEKFNVIGLNNTNVLFNGVEVKRSASIKELAEDSNSITIELKIVDDPKIPHNYHIRTEIPSRVIIEKNWQESYFEPLIQNGNEYAYEILKLLPCDSKDLNFEEGLNFDEILNIQIPYLFSYNFLIIYFKTVDNVRLLNQLYEEGIIKYLLNIIIELDKEPIYEEIVSIFNYFIKNVLKDIKFNKELRNELIFGLLTLVEKGFVSDVMKSTFDSLLNYNQSELKYSDFPFIRLLFNSDPRIRTFSVDVFNNIQIGLNEYLDILRNNGEGINEYFIQSLANHISCNIDHETVYEITDIIMGLQELFENKNGRFLKSSLTLFHRFLSFNFLNYEKRQLILQLIIDRLLTIEFQDDDSIAFESATKCLSELANTETYTLHKKFEELHSNREPFIEFLINGNKCSISKTGRVGLKRICNTCYFNTIMQMLFSIKPIRNIIMSYDGDDDFLNELSKLFVLMKNIKSRWINTESVLECLTSSDGKKVDISTQQDAAEFLQIIINKMNDVEKLFLGKTVDIYDRMDGNRTEKDELFTILDLDVQNIPSLDESFESFTQSVDLTGSNQYSDEKSGNKIDVKKYTKIKEAPPFLIIHLKRFESIDLNNIGAKIDDVFEIPFEFDISPYSTQNFPMYKLTGVIVHSGTSQSGHYICLSLSKNGQWIKIDDIKSTFIPLSEVVRLIQGGSNQGNAYILFYTMDKDAKYPNYDIKPSLLEYAEHMNIINNQKRLFCSMNYFHIIEMLNNLIQIDYNDIVLRYAVDSLPFIEIREDDKMIIQKFYTNLFKKSKMNSFNLVEKFHFLDYSINFLREGLLLCPYKFIRKNTADLILCNLNEKANPHQFIIIIFDLVNESLNHPTQFDQLFYLIFSILSQYKELKESSQIQSILYNSLENDLIPFINNTLNFSEVDMTYILEIVIMYNVFNKLNKDNFLYQLFFSDTCIDSVYRFVKLAFKENEKEIKKFIDENISQISVQKFVPFYFFFHPDEAIQISFQKLENNSLKVNRFRSANKCDVAFIFADLLSKCQSLSNYFIKQMDIWVPLLLIHPKSSMIRKVTLTIFSYIIPHTNLNKWHFQSDSKSRPNQFKFPYEYNFASINENSQFNVSLERLCIKVLNFLIKKETISSICNVFTENKTDFDNDFCIEYFQLVDELLMINSTKEFESKLLKNLVKLYECIIKFTNNPFSTSLIYILKIIFKFKIKISQALLEPALKEIQSFSEFNSNNVIDFLNYFLQLYQNYEPSESFLNKFVSSYLFSPELNLNWSPVFNYLKSILGKKDEKNKNPVGEKNAKIILQIIDTNFKNYASNNFSSMIFILNRIKKAVSFNGNEKSIQFVKRPILALIKVVAGKPQYLNINKIIRVAFALNKGDFNEDNLKNVINKYRDEIDDENLNLLKDYIDDDSDTKKNNDNDNINNVFSSSSYSSLTDSSSSDEK